MMDESGPDLDPQVQQVFVCRICGAGAKVRLDSEDVACVGCGSSLYKQARSRLELATCRKCKKPAPWVKDDVIADRAKLRCPNCHKESLPSAWDWPWPPLWADNNTGLDPKGLVDKRTLSIYSGLDLPERHRILATRSRRSINGTIVTVTGLSGMARGGVTLIFDVDAVRIAVSEDEGCHVLDYGDIQSLQFAGRGEHTQSVDLGLMGAGFGIGNAAKAALEAEAINAAINLLTSKTVIETIVFLSWTGGALTILNDQIAPEVVARRLRGVVDRLRHGSKSDNGGDASLGGSPDLVDQLGRLAELRASGVLTDEEFIAAKAKLLR